MTRVEVTKATRSMLRCVQDLLYVQCETAGESMGTRLAKLLLSPPVLRREPGTEARVWLPLAVSSLHTAPSPRVLQW